MVVRREVCEAQWDVKEWKCLKLEMKSEQGVGDLKMTKLEGAFCDNDLEGGAVEEGWYRWRAWLDTVRGIR